MLTGRHTVRDVSYIIVYAKLVWMYESATEGNQCRNEGRVILEEALVEESDKIEEHMGDN
jgi:Yippee putative zinc-binding protein.